MARVSTSAFEADFCENGGFCVSKTSVPSALGPTVVGPAASECQFRRAGKRGRVMSKFRPDPSAGRAVAGERKKCKKSRKSVLNVESR